MSDENRPNMPSDLEPEDDGEQQPPSRLDRLMGAKDRADKEAEQWDKIEATGQPLPSQDQSYNDTTQPYVPPESPRQEGDTPSGHDTPSQPMSPPKESQPSKGSGPQFQAPPPFPHPTDRPVVPVVPASPGTPPPPAYTPPAQPLRPTQTDPEDMQRGVKRPGGAQHKRYQPSSPDLEDVRLDANGMPLPRRVPRVDEDATMVTPSSYQDYTPPAAPTQPHGYEQQDFAPAAPPPARSRRATQRHQTQQQPEQERPPRRQRRLFRFNLSWGCLGRAAGLLAILGLVGSVLGAGGAAIYYSQVTAPAFDGIARIEDLQSKALQFQTTRIRDREGNLLYQINDPNGGFRRYVTLDEVSPWVIVATVATEERAYFTNPGFSIPGIVRAVVQNIQEGRNISGASTITQQLTRALLLPDEERTERSYQRKIKEIFLAAELGRRFSKREVLELYLNQIYYGNLAYGIEAAAQTYFGKSAKDLSFAESSFLAGLPQSPAIYDPVNNREGALERQADVLGLMLEAGCVNVGDSELQLPCATQQEIDTATPELQQIAVKEFQSPAIQARYPHWVVYVQQLLEADETIGKAIYTSGFDVYTTIDPRLQDAAQEKVSLTLSGLQDRNVGNASVIVIDVDTGAILAMVGSKDFNDEAIDGQVNVALTPQQPGSSIKPFTYLTAFRKGWTPASVIWDVPIGYEIPGFGVYEPDNYDGEFRGPVTVREALSNSLNIPAVQTLDFVGVPELLQTLNDVGITSLGDRTNPYNLGLSLTLGAGDVYLLEWTDAYATLANGGVYHPTYAIEKIEKNGQVIQQYEVPEGKQVFDGNQVYLLTSILSDKEARVPSFGRESPISPPYPAAAKTGTTNDFRDNWTMGFTSEIAVGVWVGNTDNSQMLNVTGVTGAGPIWRGVMDASQQWYPAQEFRRPAAIFEQTVCNDDGALPSAYCQEHSQVHPEVFGPDNQPTPADKGLYRQLRVDQFSGLIANEFCDKFAQDKFFVVLPNPSQLIDLREFEKNWLLTSPRGQAWGTQRGIPLDRFEQAPTEPCKQDTPQPIIEITSPVAGQEVSGKVEVFGTVNVPGFAYYNIEFGLAEDPIGWGILQGDTAQVVENSKLGELDLAPFEAGPLTIRVWVYDNQGHHAEKRVTVFMKKPTPTPQPTGQPTATQLPTPTTAPTTEPPTATVPAPTEEPGVTTTP